MALHCAIELLAFEEELALRLQVPEDQVAILRRSNDLLVVRHPFHRRYRFLVSLDELPFILSIWRSIILGNIIEELIPLFQYLVLESSFQSVIFFTDDVYFGGRVCL